MHLDHEDMLAQMAILSGTTILAVIGTHSEYVPTALSIAIGDEAQVALTEKGRVYEAFDDTLDAYYRLGELRKAARSSSADDCSVALVLATPTGRIEKISAIGIMERIDMALGESLRLQSIRAERSLDLAKIVS